MRKQIDFSVWIVGVAAIAVAVGSVLPWVDAHWARGSIHIGGLSGDGKVTVLCAAAALVAAATASIRRTTHIMFPAMIGLAGAMIAATGSYDTANLHHTVAASGHVTDGIITTYIGPGLWIVDIGALVVMSGAVLAFRELRHRPTDPGFDPPLPRSEGDMVVSRTVIVMPTQRVASGSPVKGPDS